MDQSSLTVTISANASAATGELAAFESKLSALDQAFSRTNSSAGAATTGVSAHGAAHAAAAGEVEKSAGSLNKWAEVAQGVGTHTRTIAMGAQAMGFEMGAATAKIDGMVVALEGLRDAVPELLVVGAALAAAFAAFSILKSAATIAGETQAAMVELQLVTENQGVSWADASKKIDAWLDSAERAGGFTRTELVKGLEGLAVAGKTGADGITYQRVAMDLARATGEDYLTAQEQLIKASEGQARMLVELGILRRSDIKDGMTQQQMLQLVEERVKGAAEAYGRTFPGAIQNLHAAWDNLLDKMGAPLVGTLATVVNGFATAFTNIGAGFPRLLAHAEAFLSAFYEKHKAFFDAIVAIAEGLWRTLGTVFSFGFNLLYGVLHAGWDTVVGGVAIVADLLSGNWKQMWQDIERYSGIAFKDIVSSFGSFGDNLVAVVTSIAHHIKDVWKPVLQGMAAVAAGNYADAAADFGIAGGTSAVMDGIHITGGKQSAFGAASNMVRHLGDAFKLGAFTPTLEHNSTIPGQGKPRGAGAGPGTLDVTPIDAYKAKVDDLKMSLAALEIQLHANDDAEAKAKANIDLATTASGKKAAQDAYNALVLTDLKAKLDAYNNAEADDDAQQATLMEKRAAAIHAQHALAGEYDVLMEKKAKNGGLSAAEELHAENLKGQADALAKTISDLNQQIDAWSAAYDRNVKAGAAVQVQIDDTSSASAKAAAKNAIDWEKFTKDTQRAYEDDLATWSMTNAQKAQHYEDLMATVDRSTDDGLAQAKNYYTKFIEATKANFQDIENAHKKYVDDIEKQEESMLDKIIGGHQSLRSGLKSIWDDIVGDWKKSIEKMIATETVGPLMNIMKALGMGGALTLGTMSPGAAAQLPAGIGGGSIFSQIAGALGHGAPGSGAQPTYTSGALNVHVVSASGEYLSRTTGSPVGVSPDASGGIPFDLGYIGGNDVNSPQASSGGASVFSQIQAALPGAGGSTAQMSALGTALQGLLTGSALAGTLNPGNGQNDANLGSQLGGIAGGLFGKFLPPGVGSAIGSLLGQLIGSLFGSHETAADQPDLNNPTYAQNVTNWNGASGQFGNTQYLPGQQYNTANGGTSLSTDMEQWLKSVSGNVAALTPAQQQIYNEILGQINQGNVNEPGSGYGIASEKNGVITFGDGSTMSVAAFDSLVGNFQNTVGTGPGSSPVFQMTRAYPNPNVPGMTQIGTYTPTPVTINNGNGAVGGGSSNGPSGTGGTSGSGGSGVAGGTAGGNGSGGPGQSQGTDAVNVTVNVTGGTYVGPGGINDLVAVIGTALKRQLGGQGTATSATYGGFNHNRGA